ncbi:ZirU family protein [Aeromonas veronii]|uniref:ZirU family protein n=1 Tax=Aeromonas veronii TaxID=654 RepID=UPI003BA3C7E7
MGKQKIAVLIAAVLWGVASGASALTSAPTDSVKGRAPTFDDASFTYVDTNGNSMVDMGDTLTIVGNNFKDLDNDDAAASKYVWYRNGTPIVGEESDTYILGLDDLGATITAGITPQTDAAITDPYQGPEVMASKGAPGDDDGNVDVVAPTEVKAVEIVLSNGDPLMGHPIVDTVLKAKVTTSADTVGNAADYNYQWMIEDPAAPTGYSIITNATNETYTVLKGDQKRKLQVEVTLKP